ncbi:DUF3089 domain-containing protein [Phocaeicola sp. HCN-6420]|uniref:DUF3089 domain-containing protein n=1 Tax=Phocaeicola sp. HCN-6420 TaxID=3134673 RepID=UPI0030C03555
MNKIYFNKEKNIRLWYIVTLLLCVLFSGCDKMEAQEYIPQAPDYSDSTFWYTEENDKTGKNADVFYIVSTWEKDWKDENGTIVHYADVYKKKHRDDMTKEISAIAAYMGKDNNFYSPFYRHIWGIERSGFFNGREKWAKGFENQRV